MLVSFLAENVEFDFACFVKLDKLNVKVDKHFGCHFTIPFAESAEIARLMALLLLADNGLGHL
jgi:hypothetical protein